MIWNHVVSIDDEDCGDVPQSAAGCQCETAAPPSRRGEPSARMTASLSHQWRASCVCSEHASHSARLAGARVGFGNHRRRGRTKEPDQTRERPIGWSRFILYPGQIANPLGWAVLAGAGLALGALWLAADQIGRAPAAALAFFVCALAPTLGLVEFSFLRFSASADRFAYIASIGPLALAGGAAAAALETARRRWGATATATATGALGIALAALAVLNAGQTRVYRDNVTFFTHVYKRSPGDAGMTFNLAKALADAGELEQSVAVAREGVLRHPHDARFPHREGEASRKLARHGKAEQAYRRAIALEPGGRRPTWGSATRCSRKPSTPRRSPRSPTQRPGRAPSPAQSLRPSRRRSSSLAMSRRQSQRSVKGWRFAPTIPRCTRTSHRY